MILTHRSFNRPEPSKEAKSLYIFCEGVKREYQYFKQFKGLDSRINIEVYELDRTEDNSPKGLFEIAKSCFAIECEGKAKFELLEGDEVWLVFDTDPDKHESRIRQVTDIKPDCERLSWNLAISNPCFEVWLYFHFKEDHQNDKPKCSDWKPFMNDIGGFDSRHHFVLIGRAVEQSRGVYKEDEDEMPVSGCTNVHALADIILAFAGNKIETIRNRYIKE